MNLKIVIAILFILKCAILYKFLKENRQVADIFVDVFIRKVAEKNSDLKPLTFTNISGFNQIGSFKTELSFELVEVTGLDLIKR